jgi:hypothetical protein
MNWILPGISISYSDQYLNTPDLIWVKSESDSTEVDESDLHDNKYNDPNISMFRAISVDASHQHQNPSDFNHVNFHGNSANDDLIVMQSDKHVIAQTIIKLGIHRRRNYPSIRSRCKTLLTKLLWTMIHGRQKRDYTISGCQCSDRLEWHVNGASWRLRQ